MMSKADDEKLQQQMTDGKNAEDLVNHPLHSLATIGLKAKLVQEFMDSKPDDVKRWGEIHSELNAINKYMSHYARIVHDGQIAEKTLLDRAKDAALTFRRRI